MATVPPTTDNRQTHTYSATRKRRRLDVHRGISHANVPAGPTREHLQTLASAGFTRETIARAAGLTGPGIELILRATEPNVRRGTAASVARLTPALVIAAARPGSLLPAVGAQRRIQALLRIGYRHDDLAQHLGFRPDPILALTRVTKRRHAAVCAVYDALWSTPGPSALSSHRATIRGWAPPLAWDDDTIDDPRARPDYGVPSQGIPMDEVAALAQRGYTSTQIAARLDVQRGTLTQAIRRAKRSDIKEALARNAAAAGRAAA